MIGIAPEIEKDENHFVRHAAINSDFVIVKYIRE